MSDRAMAFYFKITYEDGTKQEFWSKPFYMALWERQKKVDSFIPASGVPSMDSMFWLAYKSGRDQKLFDQKLLDDWATTVVSFEFDDTDKAETTDDTVEDEGSDPTQTEDSETS